MASDSLLPAACFLYWKVPPFPGQSLLGLGEEMPPASLSSVLTTLLLLFDSITLGKKPQGMPSGLGSRLATGDQREPRPQLTLTPGVGGT